KRNRKQATREAETVESESKESKDKTSTSPLLPDWVDLCELHVNSMVLVACSEMFKTMLTNGMQESQKKRIPLSFANSEERKLFVIMVNFCYTETLPS